MMHTGSKRDGRSRKGKLNQEHLNQEYCSHWVLGLAAGRKVGSQGDVALFAVFSFLWFCMVRSVLYSWPKSE